MRTKISPIILREQVILLPSTETFTWKMAVPCTDRRHNAKHDQKEGNDDNLRILNKLY